MPGMRCFEARLVDGVWVRDGGGERRRGTLIRVVRLNLVLRRAQSSNVTGVTRSLQKE